MKEIDNEEINYRFRYQLLGIISILCSLFRIIYNINNSLWLDEATSYFTVKDGLNQLFFRVNEYQSQSPLYYLILLFSSKIFGLTEIGLRLPSLLMVAISAYLIFSFAKTIKNIPFAWSVVAVFVNHSLVQEQAINARPYALGLMFTCLVMYLIIKLRDNYLNKKYRFLLFLFSVLCIYTHYLFCPLIILSYLFLLRSRSESRSIISKDLCLLFITCLPLLPQMLYVFSRRVSISYLPFPDLKEIIISIISLELIIITGTSVLFSAIIGRYLPRWGKTIVPKDILILIFFWSVFPVFSIILISYITKSSIFLNRYFVPATGGLSILICIFIYNCSDSLKSFFKAIIFFLFFSILSNPISIKGENWRSAVEFLNNKLNITKSDILLWSGLVESNQITWLLNKNNSSYLKSPIALYPVKSSIYLLPWSLLPEENQNYLENLINQMRVYNSSQIYFLSRYRLEDIEEPSRLKEFMLKKGFKYNQLATFHDVTVGEFKKE